MKPKTFNELFNEDKPPLPTLEFTFLRMGWDACNEQAALIAEKHEKNFRDRTDKPCTYTFDDTADVCEDIAMEIRMYSKGNGNG